MPYILLAIGLFFAGVALYRFFLRASAREVKAAFLAAAAIGIAVAALALTVTGRLPVALAVLTALWPVAISFMRNRPVSARNAGKEDALPLTRREAYEVLGLPDGADEEEIRAAHLRLMKKVHPDQSGSDWLAKKINAARDLLLGNGI